MIACGLPRPLFWLLWVFSVLNMITCLSMARFGLATGNRCALFEDQDFSNSGAENTQSLTFAIYVILVKPPQAIKVFPSSFPEDTTMMGMSFGQEDPVL